MVAEIAIGMVMNLAAEAAPKPIPLIAREAPCALRGIAATCSSSWSQGLHASHFEQRYRISHPETGARFFEGVGTYRIAPDGEVDGVWADSNGNIHPLDGTWDGTNLRINWGTPKTEQGRSDYQFLENGSLSVQDRVLDKSGDWRLFMQVTYPAQ
ncbi:MAG: hypothetical protein JJ850_00610 [Kordiimonadaceae bacterium]|nr:hypothetical protein [Kordiimonadaceae bacterium]MBO6567700.1 hypothetical protein [Kordiimonadaceae bacterium]MBO6963086.1 hypothetical protein [Kordiimonadaceae bacterium]